MFVNFNILNQLGSPAINSNTFANRPAAGQTGRLFVSTDTYEIYRDNGTTWDLIGGPGSSTITGSGTATQVAYFTSSQAIGSSANLFWDNTSGFLGVATATPTARIEAVKTDGIGIYANFTTNAGSGSSTTGLWAKNVTNSSGFAAVIEETTPNTTAGQYPLLIKHSLSSGTAGVGMGTGLHFQLPDDAGTFKTTQLTIETINAAAATYATRYRFNVQSNGSSTPVAYINATGVGIFTATPGAALDIHSTGTIAQFNTTSATGNTYIAFQRTGTGLWRVGDTYNGGPNQFEIHNTVLGIDAVNIKAATNKTSWQATENYTSGVARGNYFDYNLTLNPANPLASPNAISAVGASLDLTLQGSIIIPSGARSGLDAYNSISFTTTGTLTHNQGTQIRAYSNLTAGWAFNGSATGTITHLAGLRALFPDNIGSAVNVTNNYALLLNDQTPNTGTVTYTNRWGIYQEGASDLNYMAANLLLGSTVNTGDKIQITGNELLNGVLTLGATALPAANAARLFCRNTDNNLYIQAGTGNGLLVLDSSQNSMYAVNPNSHTFLINNATKMLLNTSGNLGLGVTPAAWQAGRIALQIGAYTSLHDVSDYTILGNNVYTPSNNVYLNNGFASQYYQQGGTHIWEIASSGTAGNTITFSQAMTLNNAGNLGLGITADNPIGNGGTFRNLLIGNGAGYGAFQAVSTATATGSTIAAFSGGTTGASGSKNAGSINIELDGTSTTNATGRIAFYTGNSAGTIAEKMRITSGNSVGIGTQSPYTQGLSVRGTSNAPSLTLLQDNADTAGFGLFCDSTGGQFRMQRYSSSTYGSTLFAIAANGNVLINTTTDAGQKLQVNGSVSIPFSNLYRSGSNAIKSNDTVSVSTSATTIFTSQQVGSIDSGNLIVVNGVKSGTGDNFCDLVLFMTNGSAVTVSSTTIGSPPARTYTVSGNNLQLSMASGTYAVGTGGFIQGYNLTF